VDIACLSPRLGGQHTRDRRHVTFSNFGALGQAEAIVAAEKLVISPIHGENYGHELDWV
jgi:hypothetical protein